MTDPTNNSEDIRKKPGRRNWLSNAAMAATGAVVLPSFLTGCHKDVWDKLKGPLPGGGLGSSPLPNTYYYLKLTYQSKDSDPLHRDPKNGFLGPLLYPNIAFENYIAANTNEPLAFRLHPAGDGWAYWETDDRTWLRLTKTGWAFLSSDENNRVAWKIVDGKLYNLYWNKENWENYPAGARFDPSHNAYVGVGLADYLTLTNCELVRV